MVLRGGVVLKGSRLFLYLRNDATVANPDPADSSVESSAKNMDSCPKTAREYIQVQWRNTYILDLCLRLRHNQAELPNTWLLRMRINFLIDRAYTRGKREVVKKVGISTSCCYNQLDNSTVSMLP